MNEIKRNGSTYWVRWLAGIIWGLLVTIMVVLSQNIIANDKESRARDEKIKEKVEVKIEALRQEQQKMREESNKKFTQILIALEQIKRNQ